MDKKKQQDGKEQSKMIGVVPDGWEVIGLLNVCDLINGRAFKPNEWSEDGLPIVRIENLNNNDACFNYCNFKVPCKYLLQQNDLLISWSGTPGTSFGIFNWNRGKAILNQHIFKVILKEGVEKKYFYYAYKRLLVEMIRQSHGGVGLQHITKEDLKRFEFLLPSLSEQSAIASIFSTLDDAIEKTDQLIEKYKRIKQGLMQDLFRYGIDENGQIRSEKTHKFKDSPLGRIPEEWEVGSFSNMAIINPNKVKINDPNFLVTFLGMEDISEQGKILQRHECYYSLVGIGYTSFIENDILFAKITPCMENGKGAYAKGLKNGVGFGSTEFHVLRAKGGSSPLFIYQYLLTQNLRLQARNNMTGTAGQQRVPSSFFYSYLILIPSINEQSRISSVLSSADEAIEKEQAYKEKLLALKRGLMEDLLTGKVRIPQDLLKEISKA